MFYHYTYCRARRVISASDLKSRLMWAEARVINMCVGAGIESWEPRPCQLQREKLKTNPGANYFLK